jgi:hypothetical protein
VSVGKSNAVEDIARRYGKDKTEFAEYGAGTEAKFS